MAVIKINTRLINNLVYFYENFDSNKASFGSISSSFNHDGTVAVNFSSFPSFFPSCSSCLSFPSWQQLHLLLRVRVSEQRSASL